jgi:hypothetical protein
MVADPGTRAEPSEQARSGRSVTVAIAAVALVVLVYSAILMSGYDGKPYLRGDSQYYYYTALSLWLDSDLDLANQLPPPLVRHSTDISLDKNGRIVPKHPVWMSLAAQPLIVPLGAPGALLFNLLQLALLLFLIHQLAIRFATPTAAAVAVAATGTASFMPHYVWNFSPDIFVCLLLVAALVALTDRSTQSAVLSFVAGTLMGIAGLAKFSTLLAVPGVPLLLGKPLRPRLSYFLLGLALPLVAGGWLNDHLFGSPLITSYDRIAVIHDDNVSLHSQRSDFDLPLWQGIWGQLTDRHHGLLFTSPVTLLSLLGIPALLRRHRSVALYVTATASAVFLFYSMYRPWSASHYGNRFLFPVVCLAAVPLAAAIDHVWGLWRDRRATSRD